VREVFGGNVEAVKGDGIVINGLGYLVYPDTCAGAYVCYSRVGLEEDKTLKEK